VWERGLPGYPMCSQRQEQDWGGGEVWRDVLPLRLCAGAGSGAMVRAGAWGGTPSPVSTLKQEWLQHQKQSPLSLQWENMGHQTSTGLPTSGSLDIGQVGVFRFLSTGNLKDTQCPLKHPPFLLLSSHLTKVRFQPLLSMRMCPTDRLSSPL